MIKRLIKEAHVLIGLLSSLFILAITLSGIILTYSGSLMAWETGVFSSSNHKVVSEYIDLDKLVDDAKRLTGKTFIPLGYLGPNAEIKTQTKMIYGLSHSIDAGGEIQIVTFDPGTQKPIGAFLLEDTLTHEIIDFHYNLLMGGLGEVITSVIGILLGLLAIFGIIVWWKGARKSAKKLFDFKIQGELFQLNYRLHSVFGIWLSLIVIVWGLTGAYWTQPTWFPSAIHPQVDSYADNAHEVMMQESCNTVVTTNQAIEASLNIFPDATLFEAELPTEWQPYYVIYLTKGKDFDKHDADIRVWVHPTCINQQYYQTTEGLGRIGAISKSIHSGRIFGSFSALAITLIGIAIIVLSITGLYLSVKHYKKLLFS